MAIRFYSYLFLFFLLLGTVHAQQTTGCVFSSTQGQYYPVQGGGITTIPHSGSVGAVVIFCGPSNMMNDSLPDWYNNLDNMENFFFRISNGMHSLDIADYIRDATDDSKLLRSDYTLPDTSYLPTTTFVRNVIAKADDSTNFDDYDFNGDGYVDLVILVAIDESAQYSHSTQNNLVSIAGGYITNDSSTKKPGEMVKIGDMPSILCRIRRILEEDLYIQACHEYGHLLGWPDMAGDGGLHFDHNSLGGFELMAGYAFGSGNHVDGLPSPPNPWFREAVGWHTPTQITSTLLNRSLGDLTTQDSSYLYIPSSYPGNASPGQRWYVARHTNSSGLYANWPMHPDKGGILIYHVDTTGTPLVTDAQKYEDYRRMPIDLEQASGKYLSLGGTPNALIGRDSLEVEAIYPHYGEGSNGAFFVDAEKVEMEFAFYRNPNSNLRYLSKDPPYSYAQGATSGFSMKNIVQSGSSLSVDFLINDYDVTTNGILYAGRWEVNGTIKIKDTVALLIEQNADVYFGAGYDIVIEDGATLTVDGDIHLQDRNIIFEGNNSKMIVNNRDGLHGIDSVINGDIEFTNGLLVPSGEDWTFSSGAELSCGGKPSTIEVDGTLRFSGAGFANSYYFEDCFDSIYVHDGGNLLVEAGAHLDNVPNVRGFAGSLVQSAGNASNKCTWRFGQDDVMNIYGTIDADFTDFVGTDIMGTQEEWGGIAVIYEYSKIEFDDCEIRNIFADPGTGGSGVHLWESANPDNHVTNCRILREKDDDWDRYGYGIFMQHVGYPSYLHVTCSELRDHWWTGIAVVGGSCDLETTKSFDNRVGCHYLSGSVVSMSGNCVENSLNNGVLLQSASLSLQKSPALRSERGDNRIVENANCQIVVDDGSYLSGGYKDYLGQRWWGDNNISHSDNGVCRIAVGNNSTATVLYNWWGGTPVQNWFGCNYVDPQRSAFFVWDGTGAFDYDSVLCSAVHETCGINCSEEVGGGSDGDDVERATTSYLLPQQSTSLFDLELYASNGNFGEVYRSLDTLIRRNSNKTESAAALALRLELQNSHKIGYNKAVSANRLFPWLHGKLNAGKSQKYKAGLLRILSEAYLLYGDPTTAEQIAISLRSQYPGSWPAKQSLITLQLVAMDQRDSVKMNSVVASMVSEGFTAEQLHLANNMRRMYHRVVPKSQTPKRGSLYHWWNETNINESQVADQFNLHNYPNPFNPSTVIAYTLPEDMVVTLTVYSLLGEQVEVLASGLQTAGPHHAEFNATSDLSSGLYLYELKTPNGTVQKRMMLAK